jgi:peptidoglycan hydrolase-like protein with peptidoglycan-binding domain
MNKKNIRFLTRVGMITAVFAFVMLPLTVSAEITTTMRLGSRSDDVKELQAFLGVGADGIFGLVTKGAVMRYQTAHGLSADGIVGAMTRAALNGGGQQVNNGNAPTISSVFVNPSRNNATVNWSTNVPSRGMVYYSTSPLVTYEYENSVDVSGLAAITDSDNTHMSQSVSLLNLQAGTTYYYLVYTTNQAGVVSVTWPATFSTTN